MTWLIIETIKKAQELLHSLEKAAECVGLPIFFENYSLDELIKMPSRKKFYIFRKMVKHA